MSMPDDGGAVFLKERLDDLGKRRSSIEGALEELEIAIDDVKRDTVDEEFVIKALVDIGKVFDCIPPY